MSSQMPMRRVASLIRSSAPAMAASAAAIAAALRPWQPSQSFLVGMAYAAARACRAACRSLLRAFPVGVGLVERGDDLFVELFYVAEPVADLVFGVADRLQELAVGPVPAAGVPVGAAARLVAGRGAGRVECGDGGPQADDGARVDARAGRAGQDRGDGRGQFTGLVQHLRARVKLFLVAAHDRVLPLRVLLVEGTRTRPGVIVRLIARFALLSQRSGRKPDD